MSDKINETPEMSEAQRRAEKIKAIRSSIRSSQETESSAAPAASKTGAEDVLKELDSAKEKAKQAEKEAEKKAAEEAEKKKSLAQPDVSDIITESQLEKKALEAQKAAEAEAKAAEAKAAEAMKPTKPAARKPEPEQEKPAEAAADEAEKPKTAKKSGKKKKKKKKTFKEKFLGLFPQKGDSVLECVRKVVFLCSIVAIFVCGFLVTDYYYELWASKRKTDDLMSTYNVYTQTDSHRVEDTDAPSGEARVRYSAMLEGAQKLYDINNEVVGVISIPDTQVNNPVMKAEDNDKYLDKKLDLSTNRAGEIFMDFRNSFDDVDEEGYLKEPNSDNLIIYGHNMADDQMFGALKYYHRNYNYYEEHPLVYLNSNYERYTYKIFAFFIVDAEDDTDTRFDCWNRINFNSEEEFYDYVNEAKRRTLRITDVDVQYGDPLITLSTCNTILGDRGRLIVMARRLRDGEDPAEGTTSVENENIKWPTLYYDYEPNGKKYDPDAEFVPYGPAKEDKTEE